MTDERNDLNNSPEMDANAPAKTSAWTNLTSGLSSGDKTFLELLAAIVVAYVAKRLFDNVDKAMDRGYSVDLSSKKYGRMKFTNRAEELEGSDEDAQEDEESPASDMSSESHPDENAIEE